MLGPGKQLYGRSPAPCVLRPPSRACLSWHRSLHGAHLTPSERGCTLDAATAAQAAIIWISLRMCGEGPGEINRSVLLFFTDSRHSCVPAKAHTCLSSRVQH